MSDPAIDYPSRLHAWAAQGSDPEHLIFRFLLNQDLFSICVRKWNTRILEFTGLGVLDSHTVHYFNSTNHSGISNADLKRSSLIHPLVWVSSSDIDKILHRFLDEDGQRYPYCGFGYSRAINGSTDVSLENDLRILDALIKILRRELPSIIV